MGKKKKQPYGLQTQTFFVLTDDFINAHAHTHTYIFKYVLLDALTVLSYSSLLLSFLARVFSPPFCPLFFICVYFLIVVLRSPLLSLVFLFLFSQCTDLVQFSFFLFFFLFSCFKGTELPVVLPLPHLVFIVCGGIKCSFFLCVCSRRHACMCVCGRGGNRRELG
uniref:Uncharacterized protein TCIL3000_5_2290 n=1 Tax=Trypanosoma congolense (strain IL3000) TaxID=1068625 RepID=G0UMW1_TRYCI|nr:unnamed protein product [Trypanosoma congolense IL3000]